MAWIRSLVWELPHVVSVAKKKKKKKKKKREREKSKELGVSFYSLLYP